MVMLMLVSSMWAAVGPAGGLVVETVDEGELPLEWVLGDDENTLFNITLPPQGRVLSAELTLEGEGLDAQDEVYEDVNVWSELPEENIEGFDVTVDGLEISQRHTDVWEEGVELDDYESVDGVHWDEGVMLNHTSPSFSASGGGMWKYYVEVDIALNEGQWKYGTMTYMGVDIPEGHCEAAREIRMADPYLQEVPHQVGDMVRSGDGDWLVYAELLFLSDMAPEGPRPYRVYYGNGLAEDPGYKPLLIGAELWDYDSTLDPAFVANWRALPWTGGNGSGRASSWLVPYPGEGKVFRQETAIRPGRTFSQVWTGTNQKYSDFQMLVWIDDLKRSGPQRSTFLWAFDFRIAGGDCYRLLYQERWNNLTEPTLGLYYVSTERHYSSNSVPSTYWTKLQERRVEAIPDDAAVPVYIRAVGSDITVVAGETDPVVLRVEDNRLDTGLLGTFLGGSGVAMNIQETTVGCTFGPIIVWAPNVNLTDKSHTYFVKPERRQHLPTGTYVSNVFELESLRDTWMSIDVRLPAGTSYTADLIGPTDVVLVANVRDAQPVPEGILDGGFKFRITLESTVDHLTPKLLGWGVGYRYVVLPAADRKPAEAHGVVVTGDAITLAPTRDDWMKEQFPVLKPGNINEDAAHVRAGSLGPYGNGYRLYYTGTASNNARSICMAYSEDGREFFGHHVILAGSWISSAWNAHRMSPSVIRYNDIWLMYFIGWNNVGAVGLAISSDGVGWITLPQPVHTGDPGDFDGNSIEDVVVIRDDTTTQFHMYYTGKATSASGRTAIGHATSYDGGTWTKASTNPVISPSSASDWDSGYVRSPYPVFTRDKIFLYYLGGKGSDGSNDLSSMGYAVSGNGDDFKKSITNPVMVPKQGGLADDTRGIRGIMVFEDERTRHLLMFTGQGMDWQERVYIANSGYMTEGHYLTKPFEMDRAPRALGPLQTDHDTPGVSGVQFFARTGDSPGTMGEWVELVPGEENLVLMPGMAIQFRFNLSAEFGDATPRVRFAMMDFTANVRHSVLTHFPAYTVREPITSVTHALSGWEVDDMVVQVTGDGETWTPEDQWTEEMGADGTFGYRLSIDASPGSDLFLEWAEFLLAYVSFPTYVEVDVGDDGTVEWDSGPEHMVGAHVIDVTEALANIYADGQGAGDEDVVVPVWVSTATLGSITLTDVTVVVDTPPRLLGQDPEDADVYVDEGASRDFSVTLEELDDDTINYTWYIEYTAVAHTPGYEFHAEQDVDTEDPDPVTVKVVFTDGHYSKMVEWEVHVKDTTPASNLPPIIDSSEPTTLGVTIKENQTMTFSITTSDPDSGPLPLEIRWYLDDELERSGSNTSLTIETDYEWAGTYNVRVEVFDGEYGVNHSWELEVQNVKQPGEPNGNNGGTEDPTDDGYGLLPLLLIIIIIIVAVGGALYMRGRSVPGPGPEAEAVSEPVTAEVPVEEEIPPSFEETMTTDVASGGGDAAGRDMAAAAATPVALLPLGDMDGDRTFVVEEVYVVYNDGRLMCHQARAERTSVDTDLFGGMFTAIQQFIHDSMGGADSGTQVGRLDYGENRILVERGKYIFLSTIIFGEEHEVLRDAMRDVLNRIEGAYAGVIEKWSGDQTQLAGVTDFVMPLIGLTKDLTREAIMSKTRTEGVKMLSEVEFFQGFVRLKIAVRNDTKTVITNATTDIVYDSNVLRVDRVQPDYPMSGTKVTIGTISPREKKTVAYYLDPLICQESDIDGTASYKDAEGAFHTVTMKRRRADIVCPIFFTEENANTAMLKRLIHEELKESDSKLFTIPKMLPANDAFALGKEVVRGHDVRFVREFVESEEGEPFRAEAWFYGVTKVKKDKMVIRASVWEERNTIEFYVASGRMEVITGLLAELGQNLNKTLREKYLGRVSATLVVDPEQQEEVRGLGLLIDKYSEGEIGAGEVEQH